VENTRSRMGPRSFRREHDGYGKQTCDALRAHEGRRQRRLQGVRRSMARSGNRRQHRFACVREGRCVGGVGLVHRQDLVAGSGLVFEDAGEHDLKGIPNPWRLCRLLSG